MVLTVSLQIWGLLLKEEFGPQGSKFFPLRVAPMRWEMGLDYRMRKYNLSLLEQYK